ncbi:peptidyl-prolyl cis-trans isomerase G-like isoform X2 [Eurosta solidaginis]|uniref:peptidyl-prolyl cis-trans isomerase G-like isoform X2 n=1 Tax=Eurosta solidaginis TaxID=178769 RepID=UPI00353081C7
MEEHRIKKTSMQTFLEKSKNRLNQILKRLNWDIERTLAAKSAETINDHKNEVRSRETDQELPPSCAISNSIITGVEKLRKIVADVGKEIPHKFADLQLNFTRDQKLAIYEHVVASTIKYTEPELAVPAFGDNTLSFAEIVAQKKRESKKRRRHRQSKPTHTEEVRAVVDLHMQALQQYLKGKPQKQAKVTTSCLGERLETERKYKDEKVHRKISPTPVRHSIHRVRSKSPQSNSCKLQRSRSRSRSSMLKYYKDHVRQSSRSKERKHHNNRRGRSKEQVTRYNCIRRSESPKHTHRQPNKIGKRNDSERVRPVNHTHRRRSRSRKRSSISRNRSPNSNRYRRSRSRSRNHRYETHHHKSKSYRRAKERH